MRLQKDTPDFGYSEERECRGETYVLKQMRIKYAKKETVSGLPEVW